ncbi:MAG: LacI family DNA-binding transcriptional regulator [Lentisphaeraceae bacterium]|nr:LacI family DNA-binding transcriptional regulator [Lentisphaeraceae bacterium]
MNKPIIPFGPTPASFDRNYESFIIYCRDNLLRLADDGNWELDTWGISELPCGLRSLRFKQGRISGKKMLVSNVSLSEDFIDFAKSVVVYNRVVYGRSFTFILDLFPACRFLEKALINTTGRAAIRGISNDTIEWLVNKIKCHYSDSGLYHCSSAMKGIFKVLHEATIISKNIMWPHHLFGEKVEPIGIKGALAHQAKIADEEDLINMATIFSKMMDENSPGHNGKSTENYRCDSDLFITNVFVLLCAGPRRIGEVLALPVDCLGEGKSSDGRKCRTIKFYCEKGTGYVEQPVMSSMVPYVEEAVRRAKEASEYGRWLADWLEKFPEKFPRHPECPDVDEDTPLRDWQIKAALGHLTLRSTLLKFKNKTVKTATLSEIAKAAGYSEAVVNVVLNEDKMRLSLETRKRIVTVAKEMKVGPFREKVTTIKEFIKIIGYSKSKVLSALGKNGSKIADVTREKIVAVAKEMKVGPFSEPRPTIDDLVRTMGSSSASINRALKKDPESEIVYNPIITLAKDLRLGSFREEAATIDDLIKKTGYSISTVRIALNGNKSESISNDSRDLIIAAAKEMNVGPFRERELTIADVAKSMGALEGTVSLALAQRDVCDDAVRQKIINTGRKLNYNPLDSPAITLCVLNNYIRSSLPPYFPKIYQNIPTKYKDALFCRVLNQGSKTNLTKAVIQLPSTALQWQAHVNGKGGRERAETIWDRFGIKRKDGKYPYMNSHSIRHYLDSAAAEAGLSQMERAWWAGRSNPSQNDVYDHRSDEHFLEKSHKMGLVKSTTYTLEGDRVLDKISRHMPVTPEEVDIAAATALSTPIGFCSRSIHQLPCQIATDCINCTKQFCIKGDSEKKEQYLRDLLQLTERRLTNAFEAEDDGLSGASRYVIHQQKTLEKLRQMSVMQASPKIADGSLLQLPQEDSSPMAIAIKKIKEKEALEAKETNTPKRKNLLKKRQPKKSR